MGLPLFACCGRISFLQPAGTAVCAAVTVVTTQRNQWFSLFVLGSRACSATSAAGTCWLLPAPTLLNVTKHGVEALGPEMPAFSSHALAL